MSQPNMYDVIHSSAGMHWCAADEKSGLRMIKVDHPADAAKDRA